ncbi:hypothetical protein D9758_006106 [Tetrapyrgos nigripes]|uniref:DNA repair metallo-beta-lactamase domain-containing protein n=1 Tax=Tetrapyrgos nigripes TaxID=182062 RepID=A0A8H5D9S9_9AGAR|nr:hypothetical protein D9758_006106 [Tetrapyrgos nigripes]
MMKSADVLSASVKDRRSRGLAPLSTNMARATKKNSKPCQSTTLHNFFSSASSKKPSQPRPKKPQEIIVIDSDDDEETKPPKSKKRRLSASSDEVEFVEQTLSSEIKVTEKRLKAKSLSSFGKPTMLLLQSTSSHSESARVQLEDEAPSTSFGRPSSLLLGKERNFSSTATPPPLARDNSHLVGNDEDAAGTFNEEDWDMGDDEKVDLNTREDEFDEGMLVKDVDVDDSPPSPTPQRKSMRPPSPLQRDSSISPSEQKRDKPPDATANLYSVLMSSHKENEAWKEADVAEDRSFRPTKANGGRRKAPFYKVLQGMPIAVDAFKYGAIPGVKAYFLTHAHSDHYTNLSSNWKNGPIYCSEGTANLIIHMLRVERKWVHPLPMDVPTLIPDTGGVHVTLIEANHCPGSTLFLFEGKQTINAGDSNFKSPFVGSSRSFRYLHCGDFRASPQHVLHPAVKGKKIDHVYLDTTYLDPKYTFPPQPLVISACAELAKRIASGSSLDDQKSNSMSSWITTAPRESKGKEKAKSDKVLMVVGTYSIGKERIVKAIAKALQSKVYCDARKAAILRCQSDPELHAMLTKDPLDACVHLVPLGIVTSDKLKPYVDKFNGHFASAVGFRATGWTYTPPAGSPTSPSIANILARVPKNNFSYSDLHLARNSTQRLQMYPVPYSEHSSFLELTCFALSFEWTKMIATVNVGSETSRGKMNSWVKKWEAERKKKGKDYVVPHRQADYW